MKDRLVSELRGAYAEFLASFFFVFFAAGSVSAAVSAVEPSTVAINASGATVEPANYSLAIGFAITILAFSIGDVSGGHINPAVTLAFAVTRNISVTRAALYMTFQLLGGLAGGAALLGAVGEHNYHSGIGLAPDVTPGGGFSLEFMGTLLLVFVVFNVAVWAGEPVQTDLKGWTISALAPLPIGWAVTVAHLAIGPFTGSGINPMRVLGAVAFESDAWWESNGHALWIWMAGPLLASFVGPLTYLSLYGTVKPGSADKVARTEPAAAATEQPNTEMIDRSITRSCDVDRATAGNSSSYPSQAL